MSNINAILVFGIDQYGISRGACFGSNDIEAAVVAAICSGLILCPAIGPELVSIAAELPSSNDEEIAEGAVPTISPMLLDRLVDASRDMACHEATLEVIAEANQIALPGANVRGAAAFEHRPRRHIDGRR